VPKERNGLSWQLNLSYCHRHRRILHHACLGLIARSTPFRLKLLAAWLGFAATASAAVDFVVQGVHAGVHVIHVTLLFLQLLHRRLRLSQFFGQNLKRLRPEIAVKT